MNELDLLNEKVETLLKVFQQVQAELKDANDHIQKLQQENEQLKQQLEEKEITHQKALLLATTASFSEEQKALLKQQLDIIIQQIEDNIEIL